MKGSIYLYYKQKFHIFSIVCPHFQLIKKLIKYLNLSLGEFTE